MSIEAAILRADVQVTGATKAQGDLEGMDRSVQRSGEGLGGLAEGLKGAAAGFAAFEGVKFLGDTIGEAEKTNQEVQTTIHLFGSAGDAVVEWSKTTASSMGLSEQATLGMVDGLGTMLTGFGLTGGAAKAMSENLVKLSVDVGAFLGKDPSTVLAGFQKGLTGAARGLKQYGIDTSSTAQHEVALQLGIQGTAAQWTAAQKAAVFYQLILKGTAQEVGTFAARSGDLTEETAKLKAEFSNMKEEIGSGLLPDATALFGVFDKGFEMIGPGGTEAIAKVVGLGAVVAGGTVAVLALGKGFDLMKASILSNSVAVAEATTAQAAEAASLAVEATAAEASAVALRDQAEAAIFAATTGGAVDLSSIGAAHALEAEAVAAETNATALSASAVAAGEAGVASEGMLAAIGPLGWTALAVGVGLGALTAATGIFGKGQQDAGKSTNDFIDSLLQEGTTVSGVADQIVVKGVASNKGFADSFKAIGIPLSTVTEALLGNKTAVLAVGNAVKDGVETGKISIDQAGKLDGWLTKNAKSLHERSQAQAESNSATRELAAASASAAQSEDALRIADTNLTTSIIANRDSLRAQKEGLYGLIGNTISYKQGLLAVHDAYATWVKDLKNSKTPAEQTEKDLLSLQSAQNQLATQSLTNVDAAEKLAISQSGVDKATKALEDAQKNVAKNGYAPVQAATDNLYAAQQKEKQALINNAQFMTGPARQAALDLAAGIQTIPDTKTTKTTVDTKGAHQSLASWKTELANSTLAQTTTLHLDTTPAFDDFYRFAHAITGSNITIPVGGIQRRAGGGRVEAGHDYLVGDPGPNTEMLHLDPGGGGYVTKHSDLARKAMATAPVSSSGSGDTILNFEINVSVGIGTSPAAVGRAIHDALHDAVRGGTLTVNPAVQRAFAPAP